MKRVLISSDSPLIREALVKGIKQSLCLDEVTGVSSLEDSYLMLERYQFDLIVAAMTDTSVSIQLSATASSMVRVIRSVVLVNNLSAPIVYLAYQAGVSDLMSFKSDIQEIVNHVEQLCDGKAILRPSMITQMEKELRQDGVLSLIQSNRVDREILAFVCSGLTDKEIADQVFLSPQTVRNRISNILHRCGKTNRTQLALMYAPLSEMLRNSA